MVNTMEENKKFFTPRQFERAKIARDLFHSLGCPSLMNLKGALRMNLIRDNPVTTKDVDLAEHMFGPDVGTVKVKMTRRKPMPIIDEHIEIPNELISVHEDITLAIDGLTINTLKFLSTISRDIYYRTVHYIPTTEAKNYQTTMTDVCGVYRRGGFQVTHIIYDNEFHASMDPIAASQNPPITMHYAAAQQHMPEAERNNRVIKEQFRAVYHRLPYTHPCQVPNIRECAETQHFSRAARRFQILQPADDYTPRKYFISTTLQNLMRNLRVSSSRAGPHQQKRTTCFGLPIPASKRKWPSRMSPSTYQQGHYPQTRDSPTNYPRHYQACPHNCRARWNAQGPQDQ
jgi:hypothetical protein